MLLGPPCSVLSPILAFAKSTLLAQNIIKCHQVNTERPQARRAATGLLDGSRMAVAWALPWTCDLAHLLA